MKHQIRLNSLITLSIFTLLISPDYGSAIAAEPKDDLSSLLMLDLASLSKLQVYTANRELTSIEEAPSVVTLITAEQIKRQGLKSVHEVLSRVPGFFNATSPFVEPISNRGFVQNVNTNYLLLVDGHSLNNDAINGVGQLHIMPGLDRIARIEIVRGPGSTLWGANAAMGIIHLITKNARDIDNEGNLLGSLDLSYDYEFDHQRHIVQGTYGKHFEQGNIMLSGTFLNSNPDWTTSFQAGATDFEIQNSRQMNLWDFEDSYDLYAKLDWQRWVLKAGKIKFKNLNPFLTPVDGSRTSTLTSEKEWLELGNEYSFNPNFNLEWKVYYEQFSEERFTRERTGITDKGTLTQKGFGGEAILHYRNADHHLLLGISASEMELSTFAKTNFVTGMIQSISRVGIPAITDKNRAIFFEDNYRGIEDWIFTVGLRVDSNEPRGDDIFYLPRAAATYSINDYWNIKYAYNTGYVVPTFEQTRGGITQPFPNVSGFFIKGADRIQESRSHDLQLFYRDDRSSANLTLFYHTLTDIIQFAGIGPISVGGVDNVTLFEVNASDMNNWGLELEAKTLLTDTVELYGNYAFSHAEYQDRFATAEGQVVLDIINGTSIATENLTVTGTPQHIWNLGLDWKFQQNLTFNIHYRGWSRIFSKRSTQPTFKRFGVYHYLDLNLSSQLHANKGPKFSVYIKNLFNNDDPIPGGVNSGQVEPQNGRQIGLRFGYQF